jgi:hypothetical protein
MNATVVLLLYCGLIASVPAHLFVQSAVAGGIVSLLTALSIAIAAATTLREQFRLPRLVSPVILAGLAGAFLVMLLQVIPMPGGTLINPIWNSAAMALGDKPAGSITIDTGMTLLVICRFTCMVAIALLVALIGQRRQHADGLLSVLAGIAALVSLGRIASLLLLPDSLQAVPLATRGAAETIGMFGVVLAAAAAVRGYDRSRPNRSRRKTTSSATIEIAAALSAMLVNLTAMVLGDDPGLSFAALFGAGVLIGVVVIREGRLGAWGQAGTAAIFGLALATFMAFMPGHAENELIARMSDDARLFGAGAGTLLALAPIYGGLSAASDISAVATLTIEMGRLFLWAIFLIAVAWTVILLRDSLRRGRDYVYPAAGAGCLVALLISAPSTGGSLSLASCIILSATLGLAVAQSKSEPSSDPVISTRQSSSSAATGSRWSQGSLTAAWVALGLLLTAQGAWILLPEIFRPAPMGFPNDQRRAVTQQDRDSAARAAALAEVRGDLWAESAFSSADMLPSAPAFEIAVERDQTGRASQGLLKTLRYAPHRGDAWLMLASTCERLKLPVCNTGALLKMSYYTAPDQAGLLPLRLAQALRSKDISSDDELADMVRRDIQRVLTTSPNLRPALIAAYRSASSAGRRLIEQTVTPIDSRYLDAARTRLTQ